jgi:crotonobetainyl-CoA:carnitine CoA-transferase CaiB-like acyl-CoA transferase
LRHYGPVGLKCVQQKDSIALDLKSEEGLEIVHRLAARADALVHNFRPGVPERLGIDAATLRELNPSLIHVYAASYGSTGPMSARPAFHVTAGAICGGAQAQSGGAGAPGPDIELDDTELARWSERLTRCNEANPDFNAALVVAATISMALWARARTGVGQTMETRMMLSNAYTLSEHFIDYPGRPARAFPDAGLHGLHALYRLYETRDGWIFLAVPDDPGFARLCDAIGRPELRREHDVELARELEALFAARDAREWERALTAVGVACVEVPADLHAGHVFDAPWAEELGFVEDTAATGLGPYRRYGRVVRTDRDLGPIGPADRAGAQTRSILTELGYDDEQVESLLARGVVGEPRV